MSTLTPIVQQPPTHDLPNKPTPPFRRRRFMPRYAEPPEKMTPFAQVLIDYMWNKRPKNRPPLTMPQLAVRLGVPKQSITNWVLRGSVPPLETIFIILTRLGIPLRELYDTYARAGLTVPAWDAEDLARRTTSPEELPITPRRRKPTAVPVPPSEDNEEDNEPGNAGTDGEEDVEREPHETPASAASGAGAGAVTRPKTYIPPAKPFDEQEQWGRMIAQAQAVMRAEGASDEVVDALERYLRSKQQPGPDPLEQHIIAEHSEPAPTPQNQLAHTEERQQHPEQRQQGRQSQQGQHSRT